MPKFERWAPTEYGGMLPNEYGEWVAFSDVVDLLEECLGYDRARAVVHEYFEIPEEG